MFEPTLFINEKFSKPWRETIYTARNIMHSTRFGVHNLKFWFFSSEFSFCFATARKGRHYLFEFLIFCIHKLLNIFWSSVLSEYFFSVCIVWYSGRAGVLFFIWVLRTGSQILIQKLRFSKADMFIYRVTQKGWDCEDDWKL